MAIIFREKFLYETNNQEGIKHYPEGRKATTGNQPNLSQWKLFCMHPYRGSYIATQKSSSEFIWSGNYNVQFMTPRQKKVKCVNRN